MNEQKIYSAGLEQWIINHNGVLAELKVSERCLSDKGCIDAFLVFSFIILSLFLKKDLFSIFKKSITLISLNHGIQKDFGSH